MQILNLYKLKCIILDKLRHTWTFIIFVAKLLDSYYRKAINQQSHHHNNNNNNNNVMEQEIQEELPEEQQQQQQQQLEQAQADFVARFNAIAEPMDASDMENEDADDEIDVDVDDDVDDDDVDDDENYVSEEDESDPELEEMYSDGDWTTSNDESEMSTTISNVGLTVGPLEPATARPMYTFQPARLVKCQFKEKHSTGGFPLARSGHRIIASKSHLYSLGGYNPRSALIAARRGRCLLFQELWSYNFATNRWKLELNADNASNMPTELASNALAIHNDVLIVSIECTHVYVFSCYVGKGRNKNRCNFECVCVSLFACVCICENKNTTVRGGIRPRPPPFRCQLTIRCAVETRFVHKT